MDGTRFPAGVRLELHELFTRLVRETRTRGYSFGTPDDPSLRLLGVQLPVHLRHRRPPSNHSWGLALDINAPTNPQASPLRTDMPAWMPDLWNAYGFVGAATTAARPTRCTTNSWARQTTPAGSPTSRDATASANPAASGGIEGMIGVIFGSAWDAQLWFVRGMYQEMLGREPDASELTTWAKFVADGVATGQPVADQLRAFFFDTQEGQDAQRDGRGYW